MRKRVNPPQYTRSEPQGKGSSTYLATRLGPRVTPSNSNTRVSAATLKTPVLPPTPIAGGQNLGLNSERLRHTMVQRMRDQGITDERVLSAMMHVPRHLFVDEALASRAYEDAALPIGHGQTISQPWVVARMIAAVCEDRIPLRVLEVGAGCGYQAAVLAQFIPEVHAIERIRGLYARARAQLLTLRLTSRVRLVYGDGILGLPEAAPFDAIIVAAAAPSIATVLLRQLALGGRLIAPQGGANQRLVLIERRGAETWTRTELEAVRFVPLKAGIQS
jgi:protein-L-isoaspartate(D-aspartate) O-methyltransferase